jgi:DNA helicase HerA-like ATPase
VIDARTGDSQDLQEAAPVAIVGSPSSNNAIALNLTAAAYQQGLVGALVYVRTEMGDGLECAIGTVTQIVTSNQWHENASLLGVVKTVGEIPGLTKEGDIRNAEVALQAAYHRPNGHSQWTKTGPSLSMSPPTGTRVRRVTNEVIKDLLTPKELAEVAYLGEVYRNPQVLLPVNMRDFADDRGALHTGIFGTTGSGKSAIATLMLASQFRHEKLGILLIDPQGQFSDDQLTFLPLQALARLVGRRTRRLRISHDIRLDKDPALLCEMLARTEFFERLDAGHQETVRKASRQIRDFLEDRKSWEDASEEELLRELLAYLDDDARISLIIKDKDRRREIQDAVRQSKQGPRWDRLARLWRPLHSLFRPTNLDGQRRESLWRILDGVLEPKPTGPRPYIVLDMSSGTGDGDTFTLLDEEPIKARLLLKITGLLNVVAAKRYKSGAALNTLVMLDEAHRYAPRIGPNEDHAEEVRNLSTALARYARETRKYGIGWTYITQNPTGMNRAIFDMLAVRVCGFGLGGSDLRMMEDYVDSRDSIQLYLTFANPEQTERYHYMIAGPFSPLSFTKAPLFVTTHDADQWLVDNGSWIGERSRRHRTMMPTHLSKQNLLDVATSHAAQRDDTITPMLSQSSEAAHSAGRIRSSLPPSGKPITD